VTILAEMRIVREGENGKKTVSELCREAHTFIYVYTLFRCANCLTQQLWDDEPGLLMAAPQVLAVNYFAHLFCLDPQLMSHNRPGQIVDGLVDRPDALHMGPLQPACLRRGVLKVPEELNNVRQVKVDCGNLFTLAHELISVAVKRNTAI